MKRWNIKPETVKVINLESGWNPKNSPIYIFDGINFVYKNINSALMRSIKIIDGLLERHINERGVIHTTSFKNLQFVLENSKYASRFLTYNSTAEKLKILKNLYDFPENSVLIGPSLIEGVDLSDELGKFNIIMKLSYANTHGSNLWKARFKNKPYIYFDDAAQKLVQACGRTTRHKDDKSISYILDSRDITFTQGGNRYLFNEDFLNRIKIVST
jgi:Rad3-related DNA helicase